MNLRERNAEFSSANDARKNKSGQTSRKLLYASFFLSSFCLSAAHAELSGRVRLEDQQYLHSQVSTVQSNELSATVEVEEHQQWKEDWKLRVEPRLRLSSTPKAVDVPIDGDLRDTYIEKKLDSVHVQVGSFIKAWEGTDGVNPMDIATMRDYRDPLSGANIGSFGIAVRQNISEKWNWEAMYVPWQQAPHLPGDASAWWPRHATVPLQSGNMQLRTPATAPEYDVSSSRTLNDALKNNFGARVQYHRSSEDYSVAFFDGAAQIPVLEPEINGILVQTLPSIIVQMTNPIVIHPIEYRRQTVAAAVTSTQESWIFRVAGRYDQSAGHDIRLPGWTNQIVGGAEKTINIYEKNIVFSLEYAYQTRRFQDDSILQSTDPFQNALLYGVRLPYNDDLLLMLIGVVDMSKSSNYEKLSVQRRLNGHWTLEGSLDLIQGSGQTLLGLWTDNNRLTVAGIYQF